MTQSGYEKHDVLRNTLKRCIICLTKGAKSMNRSQYQNEYIRNTFDRINLTVLKGKKEIIKAVAEQQGISVNEYIFSLINADIKEVDGQLVSNMAERKKVNQFTDEQKAMMKKWQIPEKYLEMIESLEKNDDGYFIYLKKGYVNDVSGSSTIHARTTQEVRLTINKSRKR